MMATVTSSTTRVGWIGTGVMGAPMARHLLDAGYSLHVHTRTAARAHDLVAAGAQWCPHPRAVAESCDVVITIVGWPEDVEAVYLGEAGLISGACENQVFIDMTTTRPEIATRLAAAARERGAWALDAPVSGGDVGARNGTLSIMVGGEASVIAAVAPLFDILGSSAVHQGPAGSGQHTKMCNQITIAGTMIGVCESLVYGARAGLDLETMLSSISGGAAGCWTLDNLAPRILRRDFDPGFFVDHFIKDMEIALDECRRMNVSLPGLALVHQLYRSLSARGHGLSGTQALSLVLEQLSARTD